MKKSHYLAYLNQYQNKIPLDVQKTFKQLKLNKRSQKIKTNKRKNISSQIINLQKNNNRRNQQKQNYNPNVEVRKKKQIETNQKYSELLKNHFQSTKINHENNKNTNFALPAPKQIQQRQTNPKNKCYSYHQGVKQTKLKLNQCNFQPSHPSDVLFVVENQKDSLLIACQACSQKFTKKYLLTQSNVFMNKPKGPSKYSYVKLIKLQQQMLQAKDKLQKIQYYQNDGLDGMVYKIQAYYSQLVAIIEQSKLQLLESIRKIYRRNQQMVYNYIVQKNEDLKIISKKIEELQKFCIDQNTLPIIDDSQIDRIFNQNFFKQQVLTICQIDIQIPSSILSNFQQYFASSQYNLSFKPQSQSKPQLLSKAKLPLQPQLSNNSHDVLPQRHQIQQSQQRLQNQAQQQNQLKFLEDQLLKQIQNQIPFNVQYPQQSQITINTHPPAFDNQLNKISSSQQLLIQSLRYKQPQIPFQYKMKQNHHENINLKTQPSTMRIDDFTSRVNQFNCNQKIDASSGHYTEKTPKNKIVQDQKSNSKINFVKMLHTGMNQLQDLICDQDLTLSISHPIHENNKENFNYPGLKKGKYGSKGISRENNNQNRVQTSKNTKKRNISAQFYHPLTLSELQNDHLQQQQRFKNSSFTQNSSSLLLRNNSLNITNQNRNDISFQLDQNIMIDANILSIQQNQQQNYDIISPAFKII